MSPAPAPDACEPLMAYADLQSDGTAAADADGFAAEVDRVTEQTPGGALLA